MGVPELHAVLERRYFGIPLFINNVHVGLNDAYLALIFLLLVALFLSNVG